MRSECVKLLARFAAYAAITAGLAVTGVLPAEAKDDKPKDGGTVLNDLREQCRASRGVSSNQGTSPKITAIAVKQDHPHSLTGGEVADVTVEGNFPDGTRFLFGAWTPQISEDSSEYAVEIVKQDLQASTLRATVRVPKVGNETYGDLSVSVITPTCEEAHGILDLNRPKPIGPASQVPGNPAANPHHSPKGAESQKATAALLPAPPPAPVAAAPEKPRIIRIGIAMPDAQMGQAAGMPNAGESIRTMLVQYLNGPGLEITPITAMLPIQIEAEAKEKGYDYVIYSSLNQKKSGGMSFLKAATMASSFTPIGAMAGAARATAAVAGTAAAAQAATVSSMVKAKAEYTLGYKLIVPGNATPILTNSATAKAQSDGEDVITPLIQQAATAIVGQVAAKR